MKSRFYLAGIVLILPMVLFAGDDWPQFRGPTGEGHATAKNLPLEWSKNKNVAWMTPIPGLGWSSLIVVDGRVYLTTAVPLKENDDQSLDAMCLDAKTGKILWHKQVFRQDGKTAPAIHGKASHANPTPLLHDGKLYVHFGHQGTACLDLEGSVIWRSTELNFIPAHGNGGSPIIVDDKLIFGCDGREVAFIAALDRNNGKLLWKTPRNVEARKTFSFGTPLLITVNGKLQVVSPCSNAVIAYDPANGHEIWRVAYDGYSVIPRPVYGHGLIYISTGFDSPILMAIRPDGTGDITKTHVAWTLRQNAPLTPSPLLVGDELYLVSDGGIASCVDAKTGKVHWKQRIGSAFSASPLDANGRIYFQSEDGVGIVVKAGKRFEELGRNALEEKTYASYAAADEALFIRTEKRLYRFQSRREVRP
jgi:outer membrane protein assembly factor BamB